MNHLGFRCVLYFTAFSALGCKWKGRLRYLNEYSLKLLQEMGGHFPCQCLDELSRQQVATAVAKKYRRMWLLQGDVILTSYVVLSQVRKIFAKPHQPYSWNKRHTDAFANIVFRQTTNLSGCLGQGRVSASLGALHGGMLHKTKHYFNHLKRILKQKGYSFCAWEIVRHDIYRTLVRLNSLMPRAE